MLKKLTKILLAFTMMLQLVVTPLVVTASEGYEEVDENELYLSTENDELYEIGGAFDAEEIELLADVTDRTIAEIFPDSILAEAIATHLSLELEMAFTVDSAVTQAQLDMLTVFQPSFIPEQRNIQSIEGIQYLTNLTNLGMWNGQISDLEPLRDLTSLEQLDLSENQISDLSSLANLSQLRNLGVDGNQISDLSPLENLMNLRYLRVHNNQITDLSPLENLSLNILGISRNQVSDFRPITHMETAEIDATSQRIELSPAFTETGVTLNLFMPDGSVPQLYSASTFTLIDGVLTWQTSGENTLYWEGDMGEYSRLDGVIEQTVTPIAIAVATGTIGPGGAPWTLYDDGTVIVEAGSADMTTLPPYESPWHTYNTDVQQIIFNGVVIGGPSLESLFGDLPNLTTIVNLENLDTSQVTNMRNMFWLARNLTDFDLTSFDTSNVTDMRGMFADLSNNMNPGNVLSLDLTSFNTMNVTDMGHMFGGSSRLYAVDLSSFDTRNVVDMRNMFTNAAALTELDLSSFDTRNVTSMSMMFNGASNLRILDLSNFDTRNVTTMWNMFGHEWIPRLSQLTLGQHFEFHANAYLSPVPNNEEFTGRWQNVGNGTVNAPEGAHVFTSADLMSQFNGATMADTFVWQRHEPTGSTEHIVTMIDAQILTWSSENGDHWVNSAAFEAGSFAVIRANVIPGYRFVGWSADHADVEFRRFPTLHYAEFQIPEGKVTIAAEFVPNTDPITLREIFVEARIAEMVGQQIFGWEAWEAGEVTIDTVIDRAYLEHITHLTILGSGWQNSATPSINSLSGMEYLTNLETLNIAYTNVADLDPISELANLRHLALQGNQNINDLTPLSQLTSLERLYLGVARIWGHSAPLGAEGLDASIEEEGTLDIVAHSTMPRQSDFSDLTPITNLSNLTALVIVGSNVSNITPIGDLTNLRSLEIWDTTVSNLGPLSNLTNLESLILNRNQISNLNPLANLANLRQVTLTGNRISDLRPLSSVAQRISQEGWLTVVDQNVNTRNIFLPDGTRVDLTHNTWLVEQRRNNWRWFQFSGTTTVSAPTPTPVPTRTLTVTGGTGSGTIRQGASRTIRANAPRAGYRFSHWTGSSSVITTANRNNRSITFTMPASNVTVRAVFVRRTAANPSVTMRRPGVTRNRVALRRGPGNAYHLNRNLRQGQPLTILNSGRNGWRFVQVGTSNVRGWVRSNQITSTTTLGTVRARRVPMRAGANRGRTLRHLDRNTNIIILGTNANRSWTQVRVGRRTGWVRTSGIRTVTPSARARRQLQLRQGPGTSFARPANNQVNRNVRVTIIGRQGNWSRIRIGNRTGWVQTSGLR